MPKVRRPVAKRRVHEDYSRNDNPSPQFLDLRRGGFEEAAGSAGVDARQLTTVPCVSLYITIGSRRPLFNVEQPVRVESILKIR